MIKTFKHLRFMLVMLLATLGMNVAFGATVKFSATANSATTMAATVGTVSVSNPSSQATNTGAIKLNSSGYILCTPASGMSFAAGDEIVVTCYNQASSAKLMGFKLHSTSDVSRTLSENTAARTNAPVSYTLTAADIESNGTIKVFRHSSDAWIVSVEITAAGAVTPVCPDGLTIASKENKTAFVEGDKIELSASLAAGNGEISYQWYKGGDAISGATSDKLTINSCVLDDAGSYTCKATKADCTDAESEALVLTVAEVAKANFSLTVTNGYTATINSKATHNITAEEATISGGTASLYNGAGSAKAVMTATAISLSGSSSSYLKITFADDAKLVPGCMIKVDTKNTFKLTATNSTSNALNTDATTGAYTVTATDILNGSNTLYVWKNGGNAFTTIKVYVPVYKTVSFDANDAEATGSMDAVDVEVGEQYSLPACAFAVAGKNFTGWTSDDVTITDGKFTMPNAEVTLTAQWEEIHSYKVMYGDDNNLPQGLNVDNGTEVTVATCPFEAPTGQVFRHWAVEGVDGVTTAVAGDKFTMPTNNVTLTAVYAAQHTVRFFVGADQFGADVLVWDGEKVARPEDPIKVGYHVAGWKNAEVDYDFDAAVTDNLDLTIAWDKVYAQAVDFVVAATANTKTPYEFLSANGYWYGGTFEWDVTTTNNGAYAGVKMKNATAEFLVEAGKLVVVKAGYFKNSNNEIYQDGNKVAEKLVAGSTESDKNNYENLYFYSDAEVQYMIKATSGDAQVIKAISFVDPYKVTFTNGGEIDPMYFKGTALVLPAATGEGEFQGWFDAETEGNEIGKAGDSYTPTGNITLYAQFSVQSTNNEIASFTYGEETVVATPEKREYAIELPYKSEIPASITVTKAEEHATVSEIAKDGGVFTFSVTAENGDVANYTVTFTVAKKDGICIIEADLTSNTAATVTGLIGGTADVNVTSGSYKMDLGKYIGVTLANGNFQAGDVVALNVIDKQGATGFTLYTEKGSSLIVDTRDGNAISEGVHYITLPGDYEGSNTIYVGRFGEKNATSNLNASIDNVKVYRAMNPILSALTVAGVDAVIDQEAKTISVKLVNGTDAATAVLVPTIIANGGMPTAALAATLAYNTPVNYVLTDKDGDQTTYVLTAIEGATPAAEPVITVQPASHDYIDTEVIAALTVEATVSDAGVLSYQWYKGEDAIAGATAATYTPTEAGSYKVVVTNTLGEETATATSEVAVITITHIYTFADWTEGATFTKAGEWTLYPYNKDNRWLIEDVKFAANQTISYADESVKANSFNDQYFVMKFENEVKNIVIANYCSGSDRYINGIYSVALGNAAESKKGTATEITTNYEITYTGRNTNPARVSTTTINGHFEAGVYYVLKMNGGSNAIFDIFTTAATKVSDFAGLTAGKIGDADMTAEQLAELNGTEHTLTLSEAVSVAPAVKFTYKETETYDDSYVKTLASEADVEAEAARVGDNYEISKEIAGVTYKVVVPVDLTPALALDVTEGTAAIAGKIGREKEITVTLTGANLAAGEYNVTVPAVAGLTVAPMTFTVGADNKVNATFTIKYASDADVAQAVANIEFTANTLVLDPATKTATFALTYSSVAWVEKTLQDVTESIVWDWANVANENLDVEAATKNVAIVLANVDGVNNNEEFHSQMLVYEGEHVRANYSQNNVTYYFTTGQRWMFHTTVPGFVTVTYCSNGTSARGVKIGDVKSATSSNTKERKTFTTFVQEGDVNILGYEGEGTAYLRIYKIEFTSISDAATLRSGLEAGRMYTYCPAQNVAKGFFGNAEFYVPENFEGIYVNLIQVDELVAGRGYIMIPTEEHVYAMFNGPVETSALPASTATFGMQGCLVDDLNGEGKMPIETDDNNIIIKNNHLYTAYNNYLTAGKAYIRLDIVKQLTENSSNPAPRRRVGFANNTTTGYEMFEVTEEIQKLMINGELFIIRGGKMYNVNGVLVK